MTCPVWDPFYNTSMLLLLVSQSIQRGWMPSSLATLPLGLAGHIKMQPSTALLLIKQSKVTWHKHARMCAQKIPSHKQQRNHMTSSIFCGQYLTSPQPRFRSTLSPHQPSPMRSQMRCTAWRLQSQIFTRMTQDTFPSDYAVENGML